MNTLVRRGRRLSIQAALLGIAAAAGAGSPAVAGEPVVAASCPPAAPATTAKPAKTHSHKAETSYGTLGYGPPGMHAGFQGFGIGYHPGYGYGGKGLGVGADGGYPFYGGPGYPHCPPALRRLPVMGIEPFAYAGAAGPNAFGGVGPLAVDPPVVQIESEPGEAGFGSFDGMLPYPESAFAPFTTAAGTSGSSTGTPGPRPTPYPVILPDATGDLPPTSSRSLGADTEPDVDPNGVKGLRVTRVYRDTAAERAGLRVGDVIRSANGYQTEQPGNMTWIVNQAAPDATATVTMSVRAAGERDVRTVNARLR